MYNNVVVAAMDLCATFNVCPDCNADLEANGEHNDVAPEAGVIRKCYFAKLEEAIEYDTNYPL